MLASPLAGMYEVMNVINERECRTTYMYVIPGGSVVLERQALAVGTRIGCLYLVHFN